MTVDGLAGAVLDANQPRLEITESLLIEDTPHTVVFPRELVKMAVGLAIDDFGTGYSSLSYLRRFSLRAVKIDRSFVCDVTTNADAAALAEEIVATAHRRNLKVIAGGVETAEQLQFMRVRGCDLIQGFYCGRPMVAEAFAKSLESQA